MKVSALIVPRHRAHARQGFTLIELMVTVALVAVLMVLAVPSFITFQRNAELTSTANSFLATLTAARAEAMKRQLRVFVVPNKAGDWGSGWVAFVDVGGDSAVAGGVVSWSKSNDIVLSQMDSLPGSVSIGQSDASGFEHDGAAYVMFNGSGFMNLIGGQFPAVDSLDFTNGAETRRVLAHATGRMRVCKPDDAGCSVGDGF